MVRAQCQSHAGIIRHMGNIAKLLSAGACAALLMCQGASTPVTYAQAPQAPPAQNPQTAPGQPTFRVSVDLVTTDVIVRDQRSDQFIADLKPGEFEVYE